MKKIIVLRGDSKTGKSTTLRRVVSEIFEIEIYRPKLRVEVVVSFKYKNKTIAVITIGDDVPIIKKYFDKVDGKFDILICACRDVGETFEFYNKFHGMDGYGVEFIDKHEPTNNEEDKIISKIKDMISKEFNE